MEDRIKPSWSNRILTPLICLVGSGMALYWFFVRSYMLIKGTSSEILVFDKGSFYMLGVGIGMLGLGYAVVQEFWVGKVLTDKQAKIAGGLAVGGVALIFTVPHLVHYVADSFFHVKGYSVCEAASHQWLFIRNVVYIQEHIMCSNDLLSVNGISRY